MLPRQPRRGLAGEPLSERPRGKRLCIWGQAPGCLWLVPCRQELGRQFKSRLTTPLKEGGIMPQKKGMKLEQTKACEDKKK